MKRFSNLLTAVGTVVIIAALALVIGAAAVEKSAVTSADKTVTQIYELLPDITGGVAGDKADADMPIMEIEGVDYIGVLEVPALDIRLPLCNDNNSLALLKYPCRYYGSVHGQNLVIGGNNSYQFSFASALSQGETVTLTDMTGARFTYTVSDIQIKTEVTTEPSLSHKLMIYTRDTVICCN